MIAAMIETKADLRICDNDNSLNPKTPCETGFDGGKRATVTNKRTSLFPSDGSVLCIRAKGNFVFAFRSSLWVALFAVFAGWLGPASIQAQAPLAMTQSAGPKPGSSLYSDPNWLGAT